MFCDMAPGSGGTYGVHDGSSYRPLHSTACSPARSEQSAASPPIGPYSPCWWALYLPFLRTVMLADLECTTLIYTWIESLHGVADQLRGKPVTRLLLAP